MNVLKYNLNITKSKLVANTSFICEDTLSETEGGEYSEAFRYKRESLSARAIFLVSISV